MRKARLEIISQKTNLPIIGDIRFKESGAKPLVIFIHGSFGYKDWGFFPYYSEKLAENDFIVLTINFSTDAIEDNSHRVYSPEIFAKTTVSNLIAETIQIIDYIKLGLIEEIAGEFNGDIYLTGFSLGGGVALLTANQCPEIKKLCLIAPIGRFDRYTERKKKEWLEKGYWEFAPNDIGQTLRLNADYLIDIIENKEKFDIARNLRTLKIPTKILHGVLDKTVSINEIKQEIELAVNPLVDFETIDKANHTFGVSRYFVKETVSLGILIEKTLNFFKS